MSVKRAGKKRPSIFDKDAAPYGTYEGPRGSPAGWRRAFEEAATASGALVALDGDDAWAILGLKRTATLAEARSTYRRLIRQHHPDRGGDVGTAERIIAAWTLVKDELEKTS